MIILLTSAGGSPGVTTTGLGLALTWPRDVLLVDADPHPSQAVLAGWLLGATTGGCGLAELASAHRTGEPLTELLRSRTLPLDGPSARVAIGEGPRAPGVIPGIAGLVATTRRLVAPSSGAAARGAAARDDSTQETGQPGADRTSTPDDAMVPIPRRRFLPGFAHPRAVATFQPVWPDLLAAWEGLGDGGIDVILDAGRYDDAVPQLLLEQADRLLVVARSSLRSLAGVRLYQPMFTQVMGRLRTARPAELLIVGASRPYSDSEIEAQLAMPVTGALPWAPEDAAALIDGAPLPRRFEQRPLLRGLQALAADLLAKHVMTSASRTRQLPRPGTSQPAANPPEAGGATANPTATTRPPADQGAGIGISPLPADGSKRPDRLTGLR